MLNLVTDPKASDRFVATSTSVEWIIYDRLRGQNGTVFASTQYPLTGEAQKVFGEIVQDFNVRTASIEELERFVRIASLAPRAVARVMYGPHNIAQKELVVHMLIEYAERRVMGEDSAELYAQIPEWARR